MSGKDINEICTSVRNSVRFAFFHSSFDYSHSPLAHTNLQSDVLPIDLVESRSEVGISMRLRLRRAEFGRSEGGSEDGSGRCGGGGGRGSGGGRGNSIRKPMIVRHLQQRDGDRVPFEFSAGNKISPVLMRNVIRV